MEEILKNMKEQRKNTLFIAQYKSHDEQINAVLIVEEYQRLMSKALVFGKSAIEILKSNLVFSRETPRHQQEIVNGFTREVMATLNVSESYGYTTYLNLVKQFIGLTVRNSNDDVILQVLSKLNTGDVCMLKVDQYPNLQFRVAFLGKKGLKLKFHIYHCLEESNSKIRELSPFQWFTINDITQIYKTR